MDRSYIFDIEFDPNNGINQFFINDINPNQLQIKIVMINTEEFKENNCVNM